jgi:hypothetical protein
MLGIMCCARLSLIAVTRDECGQDLFAYHWLAVAYLPHQIAHPIDKSSPFYGKSRAELVAMRTEVVAIFDAISEGCSDSLQVCCPVAQFLLQRLVERSNAHNGNSHE